MPPQLYLPRFIPYILIFLAVFYVNDSVTALVVNYHCSNGVANRGNAFNLDVDIQAAARLRRFNAIAVATHWLDRYSEKFSGTLPLSFAQSEVTVCFGRPD